MLMESLHKAYLITEAETICNRIGLSFEQIDRDTLIVDGIEFKEYKKALSYVYDKEAKR